MAMIFYATCPRCGSYTALQEKDIECDRVACFDCGESFPFDRDLLKTLDEIVEERDSSPPKKKEPG